MLSDCGLPQSERLGALGRGNDGSIESIKTPRFVERVVAGFGIAAFVRFTGTVERDVTVFIGDVLAVLHATRCWLVMQLGTETLRRSRTGFGTRRGGVYLLLKRYDLRGARPAISGAHAAKHYGARRADDADETPLSAGSMDNLLGHTGLAGMDGIRSPT
jgi:hypothetical protein